MLLVLTSINMPKAKWLDNSRIRDFVKEFGEDFLCCENDSLKCKPCNTTINSFKKSNIISHLKTTKHKRNIAQCSANHDQDKSNANLRQCKIQIYLDLCFALVSANYPIWKLENDVLKSFLEKYTGFVVLDESTIRKTYVEKYYFSTLKRIKEEVGENKLRLSVQIALGGRLLI